MANEMNGLGVRRSRRLTGVRMAAAAGLLALQLAFPAVGRWGAVPALAQDDACWPDSTVVSDEPGSMEWSEAPEMVIDQSATYVATLETNFGDIVLELYPEDAPATVNNFVCLARAGYYDHTVFHRVIDGFVIQGGDPTATGTGNPGYFINDEPVTRDYEAGTLAMANAGPNTNGSQFFICTDDLTGKLPNNYTIFGRVTEGMDVVAQIASVPVKASASGEKSVPVSPVTVDRVTIDESPGDGIDTPEIGKQTPTPDGDLIHHNP
jgi:cyclophilin family peptidyl-prolyl cis-trans isomerase